jgi:hypothetical protein
MSAAHVLDDDRVKWIRQRVALTLDIPLETFDAHFADSLERARSAGVARETIHSYLSSSHGTGSALCFASKKWVEDIEGEDE